MIKNCFTYLTDSIISEITETSKETTILVQLLSNKEELNGYHVILEFVIRKENIGQRLMCAEDFKKADVKASKGRREL